MGRYTVLNFIEKARKIHGDKYDYSKVEYIDHYTKVCVICPIHGEFYISPKDHLTKRGCRKCFYERIRYTKEKFIEESYKVHGDKYDYSKVEYINSRTKVCIICPIHGEFWQTPKSHIQNTGCPRCSYSHMESLIYNFLNKHNISFEEQKKFKWLGKQSLDFYLPEYNIAIECQGIQHFKKVDYFENIKDKWGGYENIIKRDKKKLKLCNENNVKLIYFSNLKLNFPYEVITNVDILLETIKNGDTQNISVKKC